jgi:hypothetical protein
MAEQLRAQKNEHDGKPGWPENCHFERQLTGKIPKRQIQIVVSIFGALSFIRRALAVCLPRDHHHFARMNAFSVQKLRAAAGGLSSNCASASAFSNKTALIALVCELHWNGF